MRNDQTVRSGLPLLGELLLKGQRVDWRYSLVVILVITGMFSTPLALGSIRNRAYTAVKAQIEKENNAREVALQQARDDAPRLDPARIQEIKTRFPGVEVVGNHKLVVSIEGPSGSDLPTLQTLEPGDPRMAPLGVVPGIPKSFGLTDLVVSDTVGRLLYGEEEWEKLWDAKSGTFKGAPLRLSINDLPIEPEFRVVARRTFPGRGVYGSGALGAALRRYSWGFGAPEFGLPADEGLLQVALPKLATPRCLVMLDDSDPTCDAAGRKRLTQRLSDLHYEVSEKSPVHLPALPGYAPLGIGLTEVVDEKGKTRVQEIRGDCQEVLAPQLVANCSSALVFPDLHLDVALQPPQGAARQVKAVAASPEVRALLPEATQLAERHGLAPSTGSGVFDLAVAAGSGLDVGSAVHLQVGKTRVPAQVQSLYQCTADAATCPIYADPLSVLRLVNLAEGSVSLQSTEPVVFVPTASGEEYDEILVYPGTVEDVEPVSAALSSLYPGYSVQYNVAAIDKLRRQDTRLATLFTLTIALSAVFLVLALGALARINIERRSRQMAQMLILGFSRRFVRGLVVAEYLLLTVTASVVAVVLTHLLCLAARSLLSSTTTDEGGQDFAVIVNSMSVDPQAFGLVFAVVAVCTWMIALVSARRAAKADPLNLLD
jgi:hypothetical protein